MKVFWLNGGLHIEPESDVEAEALLVLTRAWRMELPEENDSPTRARHDDSGGSCHAGGDLA